MVDMGSTASPSNSNANNNPMMGGQQHQSQQGGAMEGVNRPEGLTTAMAALSAKNAQILSLMHSFLGFVTKWVCYGRWAYQPGF